MDSNTAINDKLLMTARVLEKTGDLLFGQFGLTVRAYEILTHLHAGEDTTAKLAIILQSSPANITHKTKLLESEGLIKRVVDQHDKRIWRFSLTQRGEQILKTIHGIYEKATVKLYSQFSKQKKQEALEFLNAVLEHLTALLENEEKVKMFVVASVEAEK